MQFRKSRRPSLFLIIAIVIGLALLGIAGYFAKSYYDLRANPQQVSEQETEQLTTAVGKLYELPDEEPVVGKIQDKEKLKDQEFFKNAQNGDDLLIYQESKLAIIYRATDNKLINVGPVSLDTADDQPAPAEEDSAPVDPDN